MQTCVASRLESKVTLVRVESADASIELRNFLIFSTSFASCCEGAISKDIERSKESLMALTRQDRIIIRAIAHLNRQLLSNELNYLPAIETYYVD